MTAPKQLALKDDFTALDAKIEQLLASASARMNQQKPKEELIPKLPKLTTTASFTRPYVAKVNGVAQADTQRLIPAEMKQVQEVRRVEDPVQIRLDKEKAIKATAGPDYFNLPKTVLTPELKKDLQLLHLRNVLDPKQHFKGQGKKFKVPEFSQVGTVVEGADEFYSARINKKDRSTSLTAGLLANKPTKNRFKLKYGELQKMKKNGKKAYYKAKQAKRKKL